MPRIRNCRVFGCKAPAFVPNHYCSKHIAKEEEYRKERAKFEHRYSTPQSKQSRWKYNHVTRYRNETKRLNRINFIILGNGKGSVR